MNNFGLEYMTYNKYENYKRGQIINLIGQRFGRLLVIGMAPRTKCNKVRWYCLCDCGKVTSFQSNDLRNGRVVSCGCYCREVAGNRMRIHGDSHKERINTIWQSMRARCNNPNHPRYMDYGGRGIKVCKEWDVYLNFKNWALSNGYKDDLTIERIDNNAGYSPDNCTWIPLGEQRKNQRRNIMYKGKCLKQWTTQLGLNYDKIKSRVRSGWSVEKALELI